MVKYLKSFSLFMVAFELTFFFFNVTPVRKVSFLHSYLPNIYQIISMPVCLRANHHAILISVLPCKSLNNQQRQGESFSLLSCSTQLFPMDYPNPEILKLIWSMLGEADV